MPRNNGGRSILRTMGSNKPLKIIIVSDDYDYLSDNTLSILKDSIGDEFAIMTLSEAREKHIPAPLTLSPGVLYFIPQEPFMIKNTEPFISDVFIKEIIKTKKTYESPYAHFDKLRRKNKRKKH